MKHSKRELQTQKRECVFQQLFLGEFYAADDKPQHLALFLDDSDLLDELDFPHELIVNLIFLLLFHF